MEVAGLLEDFANLQEDFNKSKYQIEALESQVKTLKSDIDDLKGTEEVLEHTAEMIKIIFEAVKKRSISGLENLVTHALNSIWEHDYEFKITTHERGKTSTNRFTLYKDGNESDIVEGHGGGIVNIVAFILRLIFTLKTSPELRPVLILDEPFAFVSEGYHESIGELLLELIDKLDITVIMVTHQPILKRYASKTYELVETKKGISVKELTDGSA
jgi:DNA repair exonuclease SbcCD ATPase subunit